MFSLESLGLHNFTWQNLWWRSPFVRRSLRLWWHPKYLPIQPTLLCSKICLLDCDCIQQKNNDNCFSRLLLGNSHNTNSHLASYLSFGWNAVALAVIGPFLLDWSPTYFSNYWTPFSWTSCLSLFIWIMVGVSPPIHPLVFRLLFRRSTSSKDYFYDFNH